MRETIARRFAEPTFGVRHLARAHGVSERTCQMLFAAAGSSVTDEIASMRLDHARERLKTETGARIVDIAYGVGFSDLSHFNRRFRARFAYRRATRDRAAEAFERREARRCGSCGGPPALGAFWSGDEARANARNPRDRSEAPSRTPRRGRRG